MTPCSECGGSGWTGSQYMENGEVVEYDADRRDCLRCVDMPWLPCPGPDDDYAPHGGSRCQVCNGWGRFKPDPDTVMWWCEYKGERLIPLLGANCERTHPEVDCGWVARPQRLEQAQ